MDPKVKEGIRAAFKEGSLRVQAVDPECGVAKSYTVSAVLQHRTGHKVMVRTTLEDGRWVDTTEDHSLFRWYNRVDFPIVPVAASELKQGDLIATVDQDTLRGVAVASVETIPSEEFTYDLSVPGPENFVIASGILAHNSYSVGGVSLDLEKSSKYGDLKQSSSDKFNEMLEKAKATVKVIRGLQQPKYNMGIRSSFGPSGGRGVLTPAKFSGF